MHWERFQYHLTLTTAPRTGQLKPDMEQPIWSMSSHRRHRRLSVMAKGDHRARHSTECARRLIRTSTNRLLQLRRVTESGACLASAPDRPATTRRRRYTSTRFTRSSIKASSGVSPRMHTL